jgi:hypothetical protein
MKRGCNRALYETPGLLDFPVIWLEDYLDQLFFVGPNMLGQPEEEDATSVYSTRLFLTVVSDFVRLAEPLTRVSSRDLGRYLKFLQLTCGPDAPLSVLDELKRTYGGVSQFLQNHENVFVVKQREKHSFKEDPSDNAYWIALKQDSSQWALPQNHVEWTDPEKAFFAGYSTDLLLNQRRNAYYHSFLVQESSGGRNVQDEAQQPQLEEKLSSLPEDSTIHNYSQRTVKELRDICRERGLPVSGIKAVLVERVEKQEQEQMAARLAEKSQLALWATPLLSVSPLAPDSAHSGQAPWTSTLLVKATPEAIHYLQNLVVEYVQARGGSASSRDVGRYLAANKSSKIRSGHGNPPGTTALQELKNAYGNLRNFVFCLNDIFLKRDDPNDEGNHSFQIDLQGK